MEGKEKQIAEVLRLFERSELTAMFIEFDGVRLSVNKNDGVLAPAPWEEPPSPPAAPALAVAAPVRPAAALPVAAPRPPAAASVEGLHVVRAPMLGTFYRSPSPGEPPFVSEGAQVKAEQTLCLIECMKLFNTVPVGVSGRLVRFAVENATLVAFEQPIAYIQPD